jgi:hypothetical protein
MLRNSSFYNNGGLSREALGDLKGAIEDYKNNQYINSTPRICISQQEKFM